jgi:hypothetical protein
MLQINKKKILKNFYAADSSNRYLNADGQVKKFNAWAKNNNFNYRLVIKKNDSKLINFLLWFAIGLVIVATLHSSLIFLQLLAFPILIYVSINNLSKPRLEQVSPDFYMDEPVTYASCDLTFRGLHYTRGKVNPDSVLVNEPVIYESCDITYRGSASVRTEKVNQKLVTPVVSDKNENNADFNKIEEDNNLENVA